MKSELRLAAHKFVPGAFVIEIWYAGEFIGTVYGADGPGVRVVTKHRIIVDALHPDDVAAGAITVQIGR